MKHLRQAEPVLRLAALAALQVICRCLFDVVRMLALQFCMPQNGSQTGNLPDWSIPQGRIRRGLPADIRCGTCPGIHTGAARRWTAQLPASQPSTRLQGQLSSCQRHSRRSRMSDVKETVAAWQALWVISSQRTGSPAAHARTPLPAAGAPRAASSQEQAHQAAQLSLPWCNRPPGACPPARGAAAAHRLSRNRCRRCCWRRAARQAGGPCAGPVC